MYVLYCYANNAYLKLNLFLTYRKHLHIEKIALSTHSDCKWSAFMEVFMC